MKKWLRQNPEALPNDDPSALTSHQVRGRLVAVGWRMEETPTEVQLFPPSTPDNIVSQYVRAQEADAEISVGTDESDTELSFELESQLREFLITNIEKIPIERKSLKVFTDPAGRIGREYPTAVGFIDILAVDNEGTLYAFELKRARTSDQAVGQVLRYMGWLKVHMSQGKEVKGIVVAKEFTDALLYAVSAVPGVIPLQYSVSFSMVPARRIGP